MSRSNERRPQAPRGVPSAGDVCCSSPWRSATLTVSPASLCRMPRPISPRPCAAAGEVDRASLRAAS